MVAESCANRMFPSLHIYANRRLSKRVQSALYQLLLLLAAHIASDYVSTLLDAFLTPESFQLAAEVVDCRVAMYQIVIFLGENRQKDLDAAQQERLRWTLVEGLADDSMFVRDLLIRYWDQEGRLPLDGTLRYEQILAKLLIGRKTRRQRSKTNNQR